jgi:guanylate kinase
MALRTALDPSTEVSMTEEDPHVAGFPENFARLLDPGADLALISGPSAVGKDAVLTRLRERGMVFDIVVTVTTRRPRPGERNGEDYVFVSHKEFLQMIVRDEFIEHSEVYDKLYGIPRSSIDSALASGHDTILRIGPTGLPVFRSLYPQSIAIFLAPGSMSELRARINQRPTANESEVDTRLSMATTELELARHFDYIVINREHRLDEAVESVRAILRAQKCRVDHRARSGERLR